MNLLHSLEINIFFLIQKKASIILAFLYCSIALSANVLPSTENYKDIIKKAQNLILQKDRPQALNLLDQALKLEAPKSQSYLEIKKQISFISRIFLIEKAQQAYELALSLHRQDPNQALTRVRDGLKLEPDNLNLLLEEARLHMLKADCGNSLEILQKKIHKVLFQDEEVQLLSFQQSLCSRDKQASTGMTKSTATEIATSNLKLFWSLAELEQSSLEKNETLSKEILKSLKTSNQKHPDLNYWNFKLTAKTDAERASWGQKYILSCQSLSQKALREFLIDPYLCTRVAEVEKALKKLGAINEN